MKNVLSLTAVLVFCTTLIGVAATPGPISFTPGNIVVYRIGDGVMSFASTGSKVFLDEYTTNGILVRTVPVPFLPEEANQMLCAATAPAEGLITRSTDKKLLLFTGYHTPVFPYTNYPSSLATSPATIVPRMIARINSISIISSMTLTDFASGSSPRAACSEDGTKLWLSGRSGGVRYTTWGALSCDLVFINSFLSDIRQVNIFGGQLYATTQQTTLNGTPLGAVGAGLPVTNAGFSALAGLPTITGTGMNGFFFCDLSGSEPGDDTLYIADETLDVISKYCKVSGTWTAFGTVAAVDYKGLAGDVSGSCVALYTTQMGYLGTDQLSSFIDTSGYQGTMSGSLAVLTVSGARKGFRGVALAPLPEPGMLGLVGLAALAFLRRR